MTQKLEEARRLYKTANADQKYVLESLFPELKESEGEQHRKWILEYLYDGLRKSDEQFKGQFKSAIAWLEKQGEQKPTDKVESIVVRDFNSVFSREQVEEIDRRIEESQRLYNAKMRDAMLKVKDFPMTD